MTAREIKDRIMEFRSRGDDLRQDVMDLCELVSGQATEIDTLRRELWSTANIASCLANGIRPD